MATNLLEPGKKIKPELDLEKAKNLVERLFNVKIAKIIELDSYDDRNYQIETEVDYKEHGNKFVFKVTNCLDSSIPGLVESINDLSIYIKSKTHFKIPCPIPDSNGDLVSRVKLEQSDQQNAVRLMTFVQGTILNKIDYNADILFQIGQACGELTRSLKEFQNQVLAERQTIWSLKSIDKLESFLPTIENEKKRSLIQFIMKKFDEKVGSVLSSFIASTIHGDINEQNIVVDDDGDKWNFVGFLDFSDSHQAPAIFDLAILCAYITLDCNSINPLVAPKHIISGYQTVIKLTEEEWSILPICMLARFAQSVTLGTYSYQNDPDNEYLLSSAKKIWKILDQMLDYDDEKLIKMWR